MVYHSLYLIIYSHWFNFHFVINTGKHIYHIKTTQLLIRDFFNKNRQLFEFCSIKTHNNSYRVTFLWVFIIPYIFSYFTSFSSIFDNEFATYPFFNILILSPNVFVGLIFKRVNERLFIWHWIFSQYCSVLNNRISLKFWTIWT